LIRLGSGLLLLQLASQVECS